MSSVDKNLFSMSFMKKSALFRDKSLFAAKNNIIENEKNCTLKEGDEIVEGIIIEKFLFNGTDSKFYLGNISSINTEVLIKSFSYEKKDPEIIVKIKDDFEKIKEIINDNILSYFDFQIDEKKKACQIFMEYLDDCVSLKTYFKKYNQSKPKNTGLPLKQIKTIIKGILSGLKALHEENIYPGNVQPKNK